MTSKYYPAPEGRIFGRWTVESYSHFTNEHYWNVKCYCGKIHKRRASQLTLGRSNSCRSCAAKDREGKKIVAWVFVGGMSANYLTRITHSAKRRGIKVGISTKDLYDQWILQDSICALSGIPLTLERRGIRSTATASVDRIDSNKGYEVGNIQWVRKEINIMKHSMEEGEFILLCRLITGYRGD